MFLARKITRAKWEPKKKLSVGEISADAVTADLRTRENSLSFWRCGLGEQSQIEDVVLAIASAGERLDKLDIVWLSEDDLQADGQTFQDTDGLTPVTEFVKRHVDVCRLDYVRLGKVARRIATAIEENRYRRLSKKRITDLLAAAVGQGRIKLADLQESIAAEVQKSIEAGI